MRMPLSTPGGDHNYYRNSADPSHAFHRHPPDLMHELPRRYAIIVGIFAVAQVVANVGLRCHILMVADGLRGPSKYIFLFALR